MPRVIGGIWEHYRLLSNEKGKKHVVCSYCDKEYKLGNATRMREHIIKCTKCSDDVKEQFGKRTSAEETLREQDVSFVSDTSHTGNIQGDTVTVLPATIDAASTSQISMQLENDDDVQSNNVDAALARAIYATGVPLSLLESKYWKAAFDEAQVPVPSKHSLSTSLLDTEYANVKAYMTNKLQNSQALGLLSDGWTNVNGKGIVNFILTTPEPIFYKSIFPECEQELGEYMGDQMIKIIEEVGSAKFCAVITDNDNNMKLAWRKIMYKYPQISCIGCVSHTLNLLIEDILQIDVIQNTIKNVLDVVRYIKEKHTVMAYFEKMQIKKYGNNKNALKLPSKTKWNGVVLALESYKSNRKALEMTAMSHNLTIDSNIRDDILHEKLWPYIDEILSILRLLAGALRQSISDKAALSDVPTLFSKLSSSIEHRLTSNRFFTAEEQNLIKFSVTKRRQFCIKPIHMAANLLDPRYRGEHLEDEIPVATEFIYKYASYLYRDDQEKISEVLANIASFKTKTGYYGKSDSIWRPVQTIAPSIWWRTFAPQEIIAPIAIRILSVPPSSAASQRNWSLFGANHKDKRNILKNDKLDKLIYVRSNLHLMEASSAQMTEDMGDCIGEEDPGHLSDIKLGKFEYMSSSSSESLDDDPLSNLPLKGTDIEDLNYL